VGSIPVYYGHDEKDRERLVDDVAAAYESAAHRQEARQEEAEYIPLSRASVKEIPPARDLIGIDPAVYRQITAAIQSGKQHLMLYGPPGTGKTTLAQYVAGLLHESWCMITGSADWSSQDVIGGYQPVGDGRVQFVPGVLLQNFDRPLIIDELNRCDIDKVIGPLFTVLSDQPTTLPYRTNIQDANSPFYKILPRPHPAHAAHEFAPKEGWRLIATINTFDKAALYQMSFALSRRFGWIYVDIPQDLRAFVVEFTKLAKLAPEDTDGTTVPLADLWHAINRARTIGPAAIGDMAKTLRAMDSSLNLMGAATSDEVTLYLESFAMHIFPLLDGVSRSDLEALNDSVVSVLNADESKTEVKTFKARMLTMAL
jgi:5-methylcytosine-specific restriction enzyme B